MGKTLEQKYEELEKSMADLEGQVQNQQKEFGKALAFLFDRIEYKALIEQKKLKFPKVITEAIEEYLNIS